ncbi:acylphosphatase [Candidatus Dependentiae bacterium]|nr:acylphosphatase [Candidatus Dependentiae bacterium]
MKNKNFVQLVTVSGKVQGVGFRYFVYNLALQLGIKGWIKNMPDGTVKAVLSGNIDKVYNIITYIKKGPPLSRVDNVIITDYPEDEDFINFSIR